MKKSKLIDFICVTCGTPFSVPPKRLKDNVQFCSHACRSGLSAESEFWKRVQKSDGCWIWKGSILTSGYGRLKFKGVTTTAHRLSWIIHHGPIPHDGSHHGICVCHTCDVRNCVNPEHLWLGTIAEDTADKVAKGRQIKGDAHWAHTNPEKCKRGINHPLAKLTEADVKKIRAMYVPRKFGAHRIAKEFKVTKQTILAVLKRKTWTHV